MAIIVRAAPNRGRVPNGFPILVDDEMNIIEPAFSYLLEAATIPGRTLSTDTIRAYAERLHDWHDSLEQSGISWDEVSAATLAAYRNRHLQKVSPQTKRPYARATINARLLTICRFYTWAQQRGLIGKVPFSQVQVRTARRHGFFLAQNPAANRWHAANELTVPAGASFPHALCMNEIRRVLAELKTPFDLMAEWALATGMRRMEICALTKGQIPETHDLRRRDKPTVEVLLTVTKGSIPRTVEVPILLLDRTWHYINVHRQRLLAKARRRKLSCQPKGKLFLGIRGQAITRARATAAFKKACRAAGIHDASFHCLRHTFAIRTLDILIKRQRAGEDINPVLCLSRLMGHSSVEITEIYLQSLQLRLDKVSEDLAYLYGQVIGDEGPEAWS